MKTINNDDYSDYPGYYVVQSPDSPETCYLYYGVEKIAQGSKEEMEKQLIEEISEQARAGTKETIIMTVICIVVTGALILQSTWEATPGG